MRKNFEDNFIKNLEASAPDLLKQIQAKPVLLVNSEEELFSEINRIENKNPETEDKKVININFKWMGVVATVAAVLVCTILLLPKNTAEVQIAGNIIIDCNPSVNMEITNDLKVNSYYAVNDDGAEILKNIDLEDDIDSAVNQVISALKTEGYLNTTADDVLISYCYKVDGKKFNEIKQMIEDTVADDVNIIYQSFKEDRAVSKNAEENNVSVGKYVYIQTIEEVDKEEIYHKPINEITKMDDEEQTSVATENTTVATEKATDKVVESSSVNNKDKSDKTNNKTVENKGQSAENKDKTTGNEISQEKKEENNAEKETEAVVNNSKNEDSDAKENNSNNADKNSKDKEKDKSKDKNKGSKENAINNIAIDETEPHSEKVTEATSDSHKDKSKEDKENHHDNKKDNSKSRKNDHT